MALYDDVYGLSYKAAEKEMAVLAQDIEQQMDVGFASCIELEEWAHEHLLDKVLFSNMSHQFMCLSHKGEIMLPAAFEAYYGSVLFYTVQSGKGNLITNVVWHPKGFKYYDKAYIAGEQSDGVHKPLYYRDYSVPTGYHDAQKDKFNIAKPFPVFAKETGRDTSHIYTYIEHVAGECAMWLLAWLRAKLLYPTVKTQVVPIIVSRAQGSGKTTFAEVICKGLFGRDNVIVSDQYDATARFNADYADALIVCQEEKEQEDKRNPAGALKSRATATTIRKEQKGIDPIYQESYTDFIMTTNKDVPIKFDGREDQRRFMIMESDESFTRKTSELADEVFTKLYGFDANYNKVGTPFVDDKELIQQFKHELFSRADIAAVQLRQFPKTAAYRRCFTLPRTSEATEIESIMRSLAPFIKASLEKGAAVMEVSGDNNSTLSLSDIIQYTGAFQYMPPFKEHAQFVALCRPLVFYEMATLKPFTHSTVERTIFDCGPWLLADYGIAIIPDMEPLLGGFTGVAGRYRTAPAAKFCLASDMHRNPIGHIQRMVPNKPYSEVRKGARFRVNDKFKPDSNGCFETVNEVKDGTTTLNTDKLQIIQYMDTFLLESDSATVVQQKIEQERADEFKDINGEVAIIKAKDLYKERLSVAEKESMRLFNEGIVARIVYSGAKSYHLLIRVADSPTNIDEYKWLHSWLCANVSSVLEFDMSTCDPARLTRSPVTLPRQSMGYGLMVSGEQKLIAENWSHIYSLDWRALYAGWQKRPLKDYERRHGKPVFPTKQEYMDAMEAIVNGTFWTDSKFDGTRQHTFFPAYRLLRLMGYSHDELWDGGIMLKGIDGYKKQDELRYWKNRARSALIAKIDADVDAYEDTFKEANDE